LKDFGALGLMTFLPFGMLFKRFNIQSLFLLNSLIEEE
jgi:hypothetical protein